MSRESTEPYYFALVVRGKTAKDVSVIERPVFKLIQEQKLPMFEADENSPLRICAFCHDDLDAKAHYSDYLVEMVSDGYHRDQEILSLKGWLLLGRPDGVDAQEEAENGLKKRVEALEDELEKRDEKQYELEDKLSGIEDDTSEEFLKVKKELDAHEELSDQKEDELHALEDSKDEMYL